MAALADQRIRVAIELSGAVLRPGDTLVIALPADGLRVGQVEEMRAVLQQELPGVAVVFVGATQLMVYRPSEE